MIFFKSCNRCRGDIHVDSDPYGWFVKCLQCGFQRDMPAGLVPAAAYATVPRADAQGRGRLERISKDRTVILIAHRLSTVKSADRIVVLEFGEVVEEGNHSELIRGEGRYFQLTTSQMKS